MFNSSRISEQRNGVSRSNASRWCCKAAVRSGPIRPASTRHSPRPRSIPTGSPASLSAPSTQPSSRETSRPSGSRSCAPSGRRSPPTRCSTGLRSLRRAHPERSPAARSLQPAQRDLRPRCRCARAFSRLRQPAPWLHPDGALEATSFYETKLLKSTLERLVDFDRINAGEMRFSVGAVNVRTGNFVYFDNETHTIRPEHVMASGSLPPGFPAVEIEGEFYWDGGLVSNTPLQWVVEQWPAAGHARLSGRSLERARRASRQSGRGRDAAEGNPVFQPHARQHRPVQAAAARPEHARQPALEAARRPAAPARKPRLLSSIADHKVYNLVQLIYRSKQL